MKQFEVGKIYRSMYQPYHDWRHNFKVISRTEKTVTVVIDHCSSCEDSRKCDTCPFWYEETKERKAIRHKDGAEVFYPELYAFGYSVIVSAYWEVH